MKYPIELARVRAIRDAIAGISERRGLTPDAHKAMRRQAVADFLSGGSAAYAIARAAGLSRQTQGGAA